MVIREERVHVEGRWVAEVLVGARVPFEGGARVCAVVVAEGHDHVVEGLRLGVLAIRVQGVLAIEVCIHVVEGLSFCAVILEGLAFGIRNKLLD